MSFQIFSCILLAGVLERLSAALAAAVGACPH
jgi:hypothetical protein